MPKLSHSITCPNLLGWCNLHVLKWENEIVKLYTCCENENEIMKLYTHKRTKCENEIVKLYTCCTLYIYI
jgi:hypothetical protein